MSSNFPSSLVDSSVAKLFPLLPCHFFSHIRLTVCSLKMGWNFDDRMLTSRCVVAFKRDAVGSALALCSRFRHSPRLSSGGLAVPVDGRNRHLR